MLLFPHVLRLQTPYGLVDLAGFEIPPEAAVSTVERQNELVQLIDGRSLPRVAERSSLTRLRIVSPDGYALPGDRAALLKKLQLGDLVTAAENLTDREVLTSWGLMVWGTPPLVTRIGYDPGSNTEYYSYQLEFITTENT